MSEHRNDTDYMWAHGLYKAPWLGAHFFAVEIVATILVGGFCFLAYFNGWAK